MPHWTLDDIPSQTGRTILITGANSGLGYVTARELARRGVHVVLTARDTARGVGALARLRVELAGASAEVRRLDLADLESAREFARGLVADGVPVDVLVNNAGIMMPPWILSPSPTSYSDSNSTAGCGPAVPRYAASWPIPGTP